MPVGQQAQTQVLTPRTLTILGASAAALQTAIDTQTNTLNKQLRVPASGVQAGSGNVENGTIEVSSTQAVVNNNVTSYVATVSWSEFVTPV